MKKLLVLLLALVAVSGAFAQMTANGLLRSVYTYKGSDSTGTIADRFRLNFSYKTEDGNAYAYARIQYDSEKDTGLVKYDYARVKLFEGKIAVTGGKLGNWDYEFGTGVSNYQFGNVSNDNDYIDGIVGGLFQFYPVEGLDIGVVYVPAATTISTGDFYAAAKYTIKDTGAVIVDAKLNDDIAKSTGSLSGEFNGMEGLDAMAGFKYATDNNSVFAIVDYSAGDLSLEIAPEYYLKDGLYIEGHFTYKLGDALVRLVFAFDQPGVFLSKANDFRVGPEVQYNISKKGQLEGDVYYDAKDGLSVKTTVKVAF